MTSPTKSTRAVGVHQGALIFTFLFPALTIFQSIFFVLMNINDPVPMSSRSVLNWGLFFAAYGALALASAVTAYRTRDSLASGQ